MPSTGIPSCFGKHNIQHHHHCCRTMPSKWVVQFLPPLTRCRLKAFSEALWPIISKCSISGTKWQSWGIHAIGLRWWPSLLAMWASYHHFSKNYLTASSLTPIEKFAILVTFVNTGIQKTVMNLLFVSKAISLASSEDIKFAKNEKCHPGIRCHEFYHHGLLRAWGEVLQVLVSSGHQFGSVIHDRIVTLIHVLAQRGRGMWTVILISKRSKCYQSRS